MTGSSRRYPARTSTSFPSKGRNVQTPKQSANSSQTPRFSTASLAILNENIPPQNRAPLDTRKVSAAVSETQTSSTDESFLQPAAKLRKRSSSPIKQTPPIPATTTTTATTKTTTTMPPPPVPTRPRSAAPSPEADADLSATQLRAFLATQKNGLNLYNEHLKQMELVLQRNSELEQQNKDLKAALDDAKKEVDSGGVYKDWIVKMLESAIELVEIDEPKMKMKMPACVTQAEGEKDREIRELREKLKEFEIKLEKKDDMLDLTKDVLKVNQEMLDVKQQELDEARMQEHISAEAAMEAGKELGEERKEVVNGRLETLMRFEEEKKQWAKKKELMETRIALLEKLSGQYSKDTDAMKRKREQSEGAQV